MLKKKEKSNAFNWIASFFTSHLILAKDNFNACVYIWCCWQPLSSIIWAFVEQTQTINCPLIVVTHETVVIVPVRCVRPMSSSSIKISCDSLESHIFTWYCYTVLPIENITFSMAVTAIKHCYITTWYCHCLFVMKRRNAFLCSANSILMCLMAFVSITLDRKYWSSLSRCNKYKILENGECVDL